MKRPSGPDVMGPPLDIVDFQVIGELRDNPQHLLLQGDDGMFYSYNIDSGEINSLNLDDSWSVDLLDESRPHPEEQVA